MLVRMAAATTAPTSSALSPSTSRRSIRDSALAERLVAALHGRDEPRARAEVVDRSEHEGAREQDALGDHRQAVVRLPEGAQRGEVHDARDDARREQHGDADHGRAREARARRPRARQRGRRPRSSAASTSSPSSPPIQIEAAARWAQSRASISPTGLVVAGWPASPGSASAAAAQAAGPEEGEQGLAGAASAAGAVEHQRERRRHGKQGEHAPEVAEGAPEARIAHERHDRAEIGPGSQRELRRRQHEVDGRGDERDRERDARQRA